MSFENQPKRHGLNAKSIRNQKSFQPKVFAKIIPGGDIYGDVRVSPFYTGQSKSAWEYDYADRIQELPEIADEVTRSDLQGISMAISMGLIPKDTPKQDRLKMQFEIDNALLEYADGKASYAKTIRAINDAREW